MKRPVIAPENTFVLVIYCMVDPVDEERKTIGDVGLLNAFLKILPGRNVVHLSDSKSSKITSTIVKDQLKRLLENIPGREQEASLVVYYGGHGKRKGFCMDDGLCRYRDVVELAETYLRKGDSCWFLVDCCYSGNFCTFLQRQELKGSYCCIMSTTHDEEAGGDEWCLPGAFVTVMEGRVPPCYSNRARENGDGSMPPTIEEAVSFMADQHATVKMDRMTAYISGSAISPGDTFPFMIQDKDSTVSLGRSLANRLKPFLRSGDSTSRESSLVPHLEPKDLNVGDGVYAKWRGGKPANETIYLMPTYYRATVLTANDESVRVKLEHPTLPMTWECEVNKTDVTHELTFNYRYYNDTPTGLQRTQRRMAKCGKYIDYSIPVGIRVHCLWADENVLYKAVNISDRDIPWKKIDKNHFEKKYPGIAGPYVIVEWTDDEDWTIVPRCHLFIQKNPSDTVPTAVEFRSRAMVATEKERNLSRTPMECLLCSFHSAGKSLISAEKVVGSTRLSCFWAEDSEWYDAEPGTLLDEDLKVLTSHLCYKESGDYCIVRWDEDGSQSCLPKKFVRRR